MERGIVMLTSIRWRLPLSYAAIALLATVALGTVLLTTLRGYYAEREREYINRHADVFSRNIEQFVADGVSLNEMQPVVDNHSFVARSRVRLLNSEHQPVLDTGPFIGGDLITVSMDAVRPQQSIEGNIIFDAENAEPVAVAGGMASPETTLQGPPIFPPTFITFYSANGVPEAESLDAIIWGRGEVERVDEGEWQQRVFSLPIAAGTFGYSAPRNPDMSISDEHSNQKVTRTLYGSNGSLIGYLEVSEGPAYGTEIVNSVAQGLISAGAVAIILAAIAGWFVSRNISHPLLVLTEATSQMAEGHLSARVELKRKDELGVLTHSFNEMAHRVENTVNTLRRFVADAAHELHTPLTALRTNLELAVSETNSQQRESYIHRAQAQANRLESLTNNLLDLARLESRSYQRQTMPVNLTRLVQQVNEIYASRAEQAGLTLALETPTQEVVIHANEPQITRVMDNLLDNALKFTPENGSITVGVNQQDSQVEVWVKDTGIGIPREDMPHLFNRFHRGHNVAAYPGNGLGLVIIKAIVEEHQGTVDVQSDSSGTRFSVRLPFKEYNHETGHPHFAH
jgi:signal transduction histidine kinase